MYRRHKDIDVTTAKDRKSLLEKLASKRYNLIFLGLIDLLDDAYNEIKRRASSLPTTWILLMGCLIKTSRALKRI